QMQQRLDEMIAKEQATRRRDYVLRLLQEHDLPLPTTGGVVDSYLISPPFVESLINAESDEEARRLVEERAALVRSASNWNSNGRSRDRRPRSRHQLDFSFMSAGNPPGDAAEFAAAIRGA